MGRLTAAARRKLPKSDFAIPEKAPGPGSYPINNRSHAANAESRASGKSVQGRVDAAVRRRFPTLGKKKGGLASHLSKMRSAGAFGR